MMSTLARASLDGGIVVAIIWLVTRLLRLSPAVRTIVWWCAAAKFVVALFWASPILLPVLPPAVVAPPQAGLTVDAGPLPISIASEAASAARSRLGSVAAGDRWSVALLGIWAAGCALAAAIGLRRIVRMRAIVASSAAASQTIRDMAATLSARLGLRRTPQVRVSDRVNTPLVAGLFRPVILLPSQSFERLSGDQQRMVLCHELAHVKRGDLWFGCAPALAERAFFFHPLAHLAAREYSLWREAACDAAVLDALDAAPREYGRLLLDLGVSRRRTGLAAAAPWSFPNLKRRIVMLQDSSKRSPRILSAAIIGLAAVAIVPMQLVARPAGDNTQPPLTVAGTAGDQEKPDVRQVREAAERQRELEQSLELVRKVEAGKDDVRFVAFFRDDQTTMSASESDVARAQRFRRNEDPMIWFVQDGREYVIRDPETIARVQAAWRPVYDLGNEQGVLGTEQGKLGEKQGELGALQGQFGSEQAKLGEMQGRLGEEQGRLAEREAALVARGTREGFELERRSLEAKMKELSAQIRALEAKMRELNEPMRQLNEPMEELARRMSLLSRRMEEEGRRARIETRRLFDRAIANGTVEIVR